MEKKKIKKGTLKRLLSYVFRDYKKQLLIVLLCIIISSVAGVASSLFLQKLIDNYIIPLIGKPDPDFTALFSVLSAMGAIFIAGIITTYVYNRTMVTVAQGTQKKIRDEIFSKMEKLPIRFFDTHTHGEVMSYYTNDIDALEQMISQSMPQIITTLFTVVAILIGMIYLSPILTVFVVVFTILLLWVSKFITSKSAKYFMKRQEAIGKVNGYVEEMITGQKVIKVFTHEEKAKEGFDKINDALFDDMYKANKYANILMPIANNLGILEYILIAILGTVLTLNGVISLSIGTLVSFLQLTNNMQHPIRQVMNQVNSIIMALAGAERIFGLMDEKPEEDDGYVTLVNIRKDNKGNIIETSEKTNMWAWKYPHSDGRLEYVELKGYIEIENVNFGYEENKEVLHDISLYAKPGQKIAFVGATGAGKTTITNLINRFYDVKEGKIRYDGININKIKKADLRNSLGMVLQDTNLFTGTIKDNIKYGNENATDEEVIEAAKLANAHSFIERLPNGYNTMISGNGANLSQGQRQLLSIARVAANNPPVMILDEATSSIDTRTEKIVQEGMDKLMEGRTVLVIAHRLSTVRNSKAIMVMDHGRIIERGDHNELIAKKGQYYQLYTGAFELE